MIPQPSKAALVPFVSVQNMMALVHDIGLETVLCQLTEVVEADYRRWPAFEKCTRLASHSKLGVIELMPTSDGVNYSFKYVNGHPANTRTGLQTVTALGLLAEVATGYPVLLCEMTLLTALRTAATSAMATRLLAPKGADTLALIGTGAQAVFQALALKAVCGIGTVRLYDIDPAATRLCAAHLRAEGITAVECESRAERGPRRAGDHDLHSRQAARNDPDRQHGRSGRSHQCPRRGLPGKDRAPPGHPAPFADFR